MTTSRQSPSDAVPQRTPAEVHPELDRYVVVDVREPFELDGPLGHVPGSRRVARSELADRAAELAGRSLLLVCRSGRRSEAACRALLEHGLDDVTNLAGGMIAWNGAGLAAEREPARSTAALAETVAHWTAMLSQTPLDEVRARWPALRRRDDASEGPDPDELRAALDAIDAFFRDSSAPPPDLALSMAVFRGDLERLS